MKRSFINRIGHQLAQQKNLWIALLLLSLNGFAWLQVTATSSLPNVPPIIHPDVDKIRAKWNDGSAVGETFTVTVNNQEASQTIAWFIEPRKESLPFSKPHITFEPNTITGRGIMTVGGLQVEVFGRGVVTLEDGRPHIVVYEIGVGQANAPAFVTNTLQTQVNRAQAIYDNLQLPIELTKLEIGHNYATVEGIYQHRE